MDPLIITGQMPVPAASQIVPLLDSTAWNDSAPWTTTATTPGPGRSRAQLAGARVAGNVHPVGQSVTVTFEALNRPDLATNAAYETDPNAPDSGSKVVAAGDTYPFNWLPTFADWRITVTAGATPPTSIASQVMVIWDRNAGV